MATQAHAPLSTVALGWAFSAALVVLFVICLAAALLFPMRAAHGWVALFSAEPTNSLKVWFDGILYSVIAGWIAAIVVATVYNRLVTR